MLVSQFIKPLKYFYHLRSQDFQVQQTGFAVLVVECESRFQMCRVEKTDMAKPDL